MKQIEQLFVEFHEYDENKLVLNDIKKLLERNQFFFAVNKIEIQQILYRKYPEWVNKHQPFVHVIKGRKS
jgi:hypothetical protein